jgi:aminopeptidase N
MQLITCVCRQAFPCWDEPAIKATFDVTLTAPADRVVLSNMPEISSRRVNQDLKTIYFDRTPRMSTYLVAFVVGKCMTLYIDGIQLSLTLL